MDINIDLVQSVCSKRDGLTLKQIKTAVKEKIKNAEEIAIQESEDLFLCAQNYDDAEIDKTIEKVIKDDKRKGNESILIYRNGKYKIRPTRTVGMTTTATAGTMYIGAGGEMAVMSELLFRGYNVNRMVIDDGIDLVAMKNNIYTYIQVKTTFLQNEKYYWQIKQSSYDRYIENNLKYILVGRKIVSSDPDVFSNVYFVLSAEAIKRGIIEGWIKETADGISIKVKFSPQSGSPIFYDTKEQTGAYYMNRFE